jgi:ribose transport system substrate-binding protein
VGIALFSAGCARPTDSADEAGKPGRLVFITNSDSTYWDAAEKGMKDACDSMKVPFTFLRNKSGDAQGQIRLLQQALVESDIKGVAVSVIEASAVGITDKLQELRDKGTIVITVDSDTSAKTKDTRAAYVGTNNVEAGSVAGTIARLLLPDGGKVVGFVGSMDADNARERVAGFKDAAGESIRVLEVMEDQGDRSKARQNVEAAVLKHEDLAMPFGIWSYNAPAIAEVVTESGKREKLKVLTFDAEEETVKLLKKNAIDATIVQNTYDMGYVSAKLLAALAAEDEAATEELLKGGDKYDTGVRVIVPDGSPLLGKDPHVQAISEFEEYMTSKGLKST